MLEIPETATVSRQAASILTGKTINKVINATSPHKFAWYNGDPASYSDLLVGRQIVSTDGHGSFVDIILDKDTTIGIGDGTNLKYYPAFEPHPKKHQLLLVFDDDSFLVFTVAMYGAIFAFKGTLDNCYHKGSIEKLCPLEEEWNETFLENLFKSVKKDMSVKAFLATEQRIPGLGNGVLQDILFNASLHPKKKISTISDLQKGDLFHSLKTTLYNMTEKGGRDTEKDFYGNWGNYKTILSKNTYKQPCPNCGDDIIKEAYLGGTVYYCTTCQRL